MRDQFGGPELANAFAFQVGDAADIAVGEQFVAAGVQASDDGNRQPAIDCADVPE